MEKAEIKRWFAGKEILRCILQHVVEQRGTGLSDKERNVCWWDKNIQLTKLRKNIRKPQRGSSRMT